MGDKFIPNGDFDFVMVAENFARHVAAEPGRFFVSAVEAEALSVAVVNFCGALMAARGASRSTANTRVKDEARAVAEKMIRRLALVIKANDKIDGPAKVVLGLRERPAKGKQLTVPMEPPRVRFVRALHENGATPMHEVAFGDTVTGHRKPAGAVRLELFVDLISPEEAIPGHPGANHAGRPWYLRSYTRSPITLAPPMTHVPMRVVYWGRWADSMGNVGPFSATAAGWIEGGSQAHLPGSIPVAFACGPKMPELMEALPRDGGQGGQKISVVVLEAQYRAMNPSFQQQVGDSSPQLEMVEEKAA